MDGIPGSTGLLGNQKSGSIRTRPDFETNDAPLVPEPSGPVFEPTTWKVHGGGSAV